MHKIRTIVQNKFIYILEVIKMVKKSLIIISILSIFAIISSPVFASSAMNATGNTLNGIKNGVQNMANDAGNAMNDAKNGAQNIANDVGGALKDAGTSVKNVVSDAGNGIKNMTTDTANTVNNGMKDTRQEMSESTRGQTGDYTATRTAATGTNTTNSNFAIWTVLAISAIAIIALVWYYAAQINNDRD